MSEVKEVAPQRKWYWSDAGYPLRFRMPEEVETWHPSVAYPVSQPEGIFTRILWPYGALYDTKSEALRAAIAAQEKCVEQATDRLNRLRAALASVTEGKGGK